MIDILKNLTLFKKCKFCPVISAVKMLAALGVTSKFSKITTKTLGN